VRQDLQDRGDVLLHHFPDESAEGNPLARRQRPGGWVQNDLFIIMVSRFGTNARFYTGFCSGSMPQIMTCQAVSHDGSGPN
jgi:hypothetical protein